MTHIFHDEGGAIQWTADLSPHASVPNQPHIVVAEVPEHLDRWRVVGGALVEVEAVTDQARAEAAAEVNRMRGDARRPWITVLPGQEMIYLDKERQALAWLTDPDPDPAEYPGLVAEVGITGETVHEVAQVVANLAVLWRGISALIEPICLGAIAQIESATTFAEVDSAVAGARQALEALA